MFYSHTILARKSPLGTVWIAAHLERKIKKPQIDGIDIPSYAECIMFPEVPIALRLSGHLLLGLVRIYSWKVNYLFQDCNRILTTVRTALASIQIDLPADADRAPFEAITLPDTFDLDALDLDDTIQLIDTPDKHRKPHDEITLHDDHGGDQYVTFIIDEDAGMEASLPRQSSNVRPGPTEDETCPPFEGGMEAITNPNNGAPVGPQLRNLVEDSSNINWDNLAQDPPEIMCEAPQNNFEPHLTELSDANNDPMDVDQASPFINNKNITSPATSQALSPGRESLPRISVPNPAAASASDPIEHNASMPSDHPLPELVLNPSPPPVKKNRRRRPKFDKALVFSNDYMRQQIDGDELCDLVCKRRKLPQAALDLWKFSRIHQKDSLFHETRLDGVCTSLHEIHERNFPIVNDSDSTPELSQGVVGAPNVGVQDAQAEPQLPPRSPGNADVRPDGSMLDEDMAPELPRHDVESNLFDNMPSPSGREDLTPFKTADITPGSDYGGTFETEILPTVGSTLSYGGLTSLPDDEDFYRDLPEIPELPNSPEHPTSDVRDLGFLMSNDTSPATEGGTGLGSMSARTRAVAQYFKDRTPSTQTSDDQPGKFSLNEILEGKTRKHAARMFFETLVLKSYDYIDVQQEVAYGEISVSVKPSLSTAKF